VPVRTLKASATSRLKATYRKDSVLLGPLYRHVMRAAGTDDGERAMNVMHPSDLCKTDWCGRHDYYRMTETPAIEGSANPSFKMENVFAEGHTIHEKYQNWFWEMGILYGWWSCKNCWASFQALSPLVCPYCHSVLLEYREVPLVDSRLMISGHADAALHGLEGVGDCLVEIKSIGVGTLQFEAPHLHAAYLEGAKLDEIWFKLQRPFGSHLRQGLFYLYLSQGRYEQIVFIYESKFSQQTKEFVVKRNDALIANRLDEAKDVAQCIRSGIVPDRPIWAEEDGPLCKSCPYRNTCWSKEKTHEAPTPVYKVTRTTQVKRQRALRQA
jgi:hypothetical protein